MFGLSIGFVVPVSINILCSTLLMYPLMKTLLSNKCKDATCAIFIGAYLTKVDECINPSLFSDIVEICRSMFFLQLLRGCLNLPQSQQSSDLLTNLSDQLRSTCCGRDLIYRSANISNVFYKAKINARYVS